ncbi:unnamed protein product [Ophioblennius macclurei]
MKYLLLLGIVLLNFRISDSAPDFCQLKPDIGEGTGFIYAVYYEPEKDQCSPFLYKGDKGNQNRFLNERECIRNCSDNAEKIYPMDATKACTFKKLSGGCSGSYLRYYYDPIHDKCKKFLWTGCLGNGNRFTDSGSCNNTCVGIHEDGDDDEEDEPDTDIKIICGVLIGLVLAGILIAAIVLTVRSVKKKNKKKSKGKRRDANTDAPLQDGEIEMS